MAACGSVCLVAVPESSKCRRLYVSPQWLHWPLKYHMTVTMLQSDWISWISSRAKEKSKGSWLSFPPCDHELIHCMLGKNQGSSLPDYWSLVWTPNPTAQPVMVRAAIPPARRERLARETRVQTRLHHPTYFYLTIHRSTTQTLTLLTV